MSTFLQILVATILKMISTKVVEVIWEMAIKRAYIKLRKMIARALLKCLYPGYLEARCNCDDKQDTDPARATQNIARSRSATRSSRLRSAVTNMRVPTTLE